MQDDAPVTDYAATESGSVVSSFVDASGTSSASSVEQLFPAPLHDGRLAYLQYCFGKESREPGTVGSLHAYEFRRKTTSLVRPYRLPVFTGRFAFSPVADNGLLNDGHGLGERLTWLGPRSLRPVTLPVSRVGDPAWSADGSRVINGVPASAGMDSPQRADTPWSLYLLDRHGRMERRLPWELRDGAPPPGRLMAGG